MFLFFVLNFLAGLTAYLCARALFDGKAYDHGLEKNIDFISAVFVLYLAVIVSAVLLLGIAGRLYTLDLFLLFFAASICALLFLPKPGYGAVFAPLGAAVSRIVPDKVLRLGLSVLIAFGLTKVMVNLFNPPFGWDSLNYHFTFAVEWLKNGDLNVPITINDDFAPTYYPLNGSIYFFWLIAPLRSVFLADLGQLPFFVLAFFSLFGIARKLSLDRRAAFMAASLFSLIPNYFKQLQIAYVDIMVGALFFFCLNTIFLMEKRFSKGAVLFLGAGMGLLVGMKLVAMPYFLILLAVSLFVIFKYGGGGRAAAFAALFGLILALGGFSYIRNFVETGNPFYPLVIKLFGNPVLPGVIERSSYASHFKASDFSLGKLLFHEGLGAQVLLFVMPGALFSIPFAFSKAARRKGGLFIFFLFLPLALWLVFRYLIPFANTRYLYPLLGAGMVCGFYLARAMNLPRVLLNIIYCLCVLSSMPELARRQELVFSTLFSIAAFVLLPYLFRRWPRIRLNSKPVFIALSVAALFFFLKSAQAFYNKNEFRRYTVMRKYSGFWPDATAAWLWLDTNTTSSNIAYVGRPVPFPLYGSSLKNNVCYVSVNAVHPAKLHYYKGSFYHWDHDYSRMQADFASGSNYRSGASYAVWIENLRKCNADYLFVYSLHQTKEIEFPIEEEWAGARTEIFQPVFKNDTIRIYRIKNA